MPKPLKAGNHAQEPNSHTKRRRWSYSITGADGKVRQLRSRKDESKKEFRLRCDMLDSQSEEMTTTSDITLNELFYLWVNDYVKVKLSPSDYRTTPPIYERNVKPYLGQRNITDIKRSDVYRILSKAEQKGLSASYIKKIRGCISRPYNWAINSLGFDIVSPTQGLIYTPKDNRPRFPSKFISDDDYKRFIAHAKTSKYHHYFGLLYHTGLRPSEGLGLQIKDIKDNYLEIRRGVTKDGLSTLKTANAVRDIPLTSYVKTLLAEQVREVAFLTPEGWLFPTMSGRPEFDAVRDAMRRIIRNANNSNKRQKGANKGLVEIPLPINNYSLYDFRHTFATRMAEAGMNVKTLQYIMGHASIEVTMKYYVSVTDKMVSDAIDTMENVNQA